MKARWIPGALMRDLLLTTCLALLCASSAAQALDEALDEALDQEEWRDQLWQFHSMTEEGETLPTATFGFPERAPILRAGCDPLTHDVYISYPDGPIPDRLGELKLVIEGRSLDYAMRAERVAGGVHAWSPPTPDLLAALHQDSVLQLRLPYQREPLGIGRAQPLRRVAELCGALQ
jgi:hypothetical protein